MPSALGVTSRLFPGVSTRSGVKTLSVCPARNATALWVVCSTFQIPTVPSRLVVASQLPSFVQARPVTCFLCPIR